MYTDVNKFGLLTAVARILFPLYHTLIDYDDMKMTIEEKYFSCIRNIRNKNFTGIGKCEGVEKRVKTLNISVILQAEFLSDYIVFRMQNR